MQREALFQKRPWGLGTELGTIIGTTHCPILEAGIGFSSRTCAPQSSYIPMMCPLSQCEEHFEIFKRGINSMGKSIPSAQEPLVAINFLKYHLRMRTLRISRELCRQQTHHVGRYNKFFFSKRNINYSTILQYSSAVYTRF